MSEKEGSPKEGGPTLNKKKEKKEHLTKTSQDLKHPGFKCFHGFRGLFQVDSNITGPLGNIMFG